MRNLQGHFQSISVFLSIWVNFSRFSLSIVEAFVSSHQISVAFSQFQSIFVSCGTRQKRRIFYRQAWNPPTPWSSVTNPSPVSPVLTSSASWNSGSTPLFKPFRFPKFHLSDSHNLIMFMRGSTRGRYRSSRLWSLTLRILLPLLVRGKVGQNNTPT